MLHRAGFTVVGETAILFIPGWLRMLDLTCHARCRQLAAVTVALVRPFEWLDRRVPAVAGWIPARNIRDQTAGLIALVALLADFALRERSAPPSRRSSVGSRPSGGERLRADRNGA